MFDNDAAGLCNFVLTFYSRRNEIVSDTPNGQIGMILLKLELKKKLNSYIFDYAQDFVLLN
jgi:hypothetical protein